MEKIFQYIDGKIEELQQEIDSGISTLDQKSKDNRSSEIHLMLMYLDIYKYDLRTTENELYKIFDYIKKLEEFWAHY